MKGPQKESNQNNSSQPNNAGIIIWTFRRTGGTNLTSAIIKSLGGKTVEHEPFNTDRVFGSITTQWRETRDIEQLRSSLHEIFSQNISFKHCLEIIPMEMNFLILELATEYGYKHLFLYRENAADRLLSLNYAMRTGIWGSKGEAPIECGTDVFSEPVNISKLLNHEATCRHDMRSIYTNLISKGDSPIAVSFESIYKRSQQYSKALVKELFEQVTGSRPARFKSLYQNLVSYGSQGTSSDYLRFPGADALAVQVDKLGPFQLHHKINCQVALADSENQVVYSEFWDALPSAQAEKYYIHGVILCDTQEQVKIKIMQRDKSVHVTTGLASRRIAKMYPHISNASHCRFFSGPISCEEAFIYSVGGPNKNNLLARLEFITDSVTSCKKNN
jgi:hypothetical protein